MRTERSRLAAIFCLGVLFAVLAPASAPILANEKKAKDKKVEPKKTRHDEISDAIDAGIEYLLDEVKAKQVGSHAHGQVALETYALIVAGVSVKHPTIRANIEYLDKSVPGGGTKRSTYTLACYIFALDAAISQIEQDLLMLAPSKLRKKFRDDPRIGREYRANLKKAVTRLAGIQGTHGGWNYDRPTDRFDNSNTQFAVLGLGVGVKRNVPMAKDVWTKIMDHFVGGQQKKGPETADRITLMNPTDKEEWNSGVTIRAAEEKEGKDDGEKKGTSRKKKKGGRTVVVKPKLPESPEVGLEGIKVFRRGFDYSNKNGATWNMTCAGLSSLILARQSLERRITVNQRNALNQAIHDGYGWLMGHWNPNKSYYGMYSLEKVGDLGEVKLFGNHDWYEELASHLIGAQRNDGSWPGGGAHGEKNEPRVASSFALLILNRASSMLTRNPQSRIVISGRSSNDDPNDRSWVYVPALDTTIHYPSLMRSIRLRPSAKLIRFLKNIVSSYPPEWKGELIPDMARVRDSIRNKTARGIIEKYLVDITGSDYDDWESYLKWHRRWERVRLIGEQVSKKHIPDLITYYKNTNKSPALKQTIMWALVRCRAENAIPLFLDDLESSSAVVRHAAYTSFKSFFSDFPPAFDATSKSSVRTTQIAEIRAWYAKQRRSASRASG
jgi:hypothetical protein